MTKQYECALVSCARWEAESVVEWLNFHRSIGFDHAFLYCNDDDPVEFFEAVTPFVDSGFVHFYHHPIQGQQEAMLTHFLRNHATECEWFAFFDLDEFLLLRHQDTVTEFLKTFEIPPDAVHFNTLNAGHNGHLTRPKGSVIENFPRRKDEVEGFTKCLVRSAAYDPSRLDDAYDAAWWHNIAAIMKADARIVNVLGDDMSTYYHDVGTHWPRMNTPEFHARVIDRAAIYHCGMKSEADLIRRFDRGTGGVHGAQADWKMLHDRGREAILSYLTPMNAVHESRLLDLRQKSLGRAYSTQLAPPRIGENIAPQGRAMQSSIDSTSRIQDIYQDAAGVINGRPNGLHSHCTAYEDSPWWQVEFEGPRQVREVRVFNRVDASRDRFRNFMMLSSLDGKAWKVLFEKRDDVPFGGVDGRMFIWKSDTPEDLKILRIQGVDRCLIYLDQVEIY